MGQAGLELVRQGDESEAIEGSVEEGHFFYMSSKWAEFLHVAFDSVEKHYPVVLRKFLICFEEKPYAKNMSAFFASFYSKQKQKKLIKFFVS